VKPLSDGMKNSMLKNIEKKGFAKPFKKYTTIISGPDIENDELFQKMMAKEKTDKPLWKAIGGLLGDVIDPLLSDPAIYASSASTASTAPEVTLTNETLDKAYKEMKECSKKHPCRQSLGWIGALRTP
jgi:hypothetical protein